VRKKEKKQEPHAPHIRRRSASHLLAVHRRGRALAEGAELGEPQPAVEALRVVAVAARELFAGLVVFELHDADRAHLAGKGAAGRGGEEEGGGWRAGDGDSR
jgi:DNA-directed RNA polymerase subunit K/omega